MATKYFTCTETAKIIRKALKESFTDMKFSVTSKIYSGGASISVSWTNGANQAQVESVIRHFKGAYFDPSIDYQGNIYHMMDGQQVSFGADFIFCNRHYSDAAIQRAIDRVYRKYEGNFSDSPEPKATVEEFSKGKYWNANVPGLYVCRDHTIQALIQGEMAKFSDRMRVQESATAKKAFVTHDDNYSNTNGSGFSVMPANL